MGPVIDIQVDILKTVWFLAPQRRKSVELPQFLCVGTATPLDVANEPIYEVANCKWAWGSQPIISCY